MARQAATTADIMGRTFQSLSSVRGGSDEEDAVHGMVDDVHGVVDDVHGVVDDVGWW